MQITAKFTIALVFSVMYVCLCMHVLIVIEHVLLKIMRCLVLHADIIFGDKDGSVLDAKRIWPDKSFSQGFL